MNDIIVASSVLGRSCATQLLGPWAIEPDLFAKMWGIAQANIHIVNTPKAEKAAEASVEDNRTVKAFKVGKVGVIPLHGANTKERHSFQSMFGGYSTAEARNVIRSMAADASIGAIVLHIDSPGGAVSGTGDFADDVHEIAKGKPVLAYVEDLAASAAMWIGSQASHITASPHALVGSIGVYTTIYDESAAFEKAGVKAIVVKAGEVKAAGARGVPVDAKALGEIQGRINDINADFVAAVARGRKLDIETVKASNTGGVWMASEAQKRGLIDAIGSFDDVMRRAAALAGQSDLKTAVAMAQQKSIISEALASPPSLSAAEAPKVEANTEAAAPSEAPVQPAQDPDVKSQVAFDEPAHDEPAEKPATSSDASVSTETKMPEAAGEQPHELRPNEESTMDENTIKAMIAEQSAKAAAAALAAYKEEDAKARVSTLREEIAAETGFSVEALAGFDEKGLKAFAAEWRAKNSGVGTLPRGVRRNTSAASDEDVKVFSEADAIAGTADDWYTPEQRATMSKKAVA